MKLRNLFILVAFSIPATVFFTSCSDNEEPTSPTVDITDPNESFYKGDEVIYLCDFQNTKTVSEFVTLYNLSDLAPATDMVNIGFTNKEVSWLLQMRDSYSSKNYFAGSTSKFTTVGQANAWLVTTPIEVPSEGCVLSWKSEALHLTKRDGLKVFISTKGGNPASDFTTVPEWFIEEEVAGTTENIDGEWAEHELSLDKYAGKKVWIAFVNQSTDKYILCLDDIYVTKRMNFALSSETEKVTAADLITIKGNLTAKTRAITGYTVHYTTADSIVYTEQYSGLSIQPGESHAFEFKNKLPLTAKGGHIPYKIWASVQGAERVGLVDSVAAYAFIPQHKVVLEEGTGAWCGYCPLGIISIENLQALYPEQIIAIGVHNRDVMTVTEYDAGLRFGSYPIGIINRQYLCDPVSNTAGYSFEGTKTFLSVFREVIKNTPMVETKITQAKLVGKSAIEVKAEVKFALQPSSSGYRIAYVVIENDLVAPTTQANYLNTNSNPILGRFGYGKELGVSSIKGYPYQKVARGIYPSFKGSRELLPASLLLNTPHALTYTINLSQTTIANTDKLEVIVMLLDDSNGVILNADKTEATL